MEESTRKVIFRGGTGKNFLYFDNPSEEQELEERLNKRALLPHKMKEGPLYFCVLENPIRRGICLRFDRMWASVSRESRQAYLDLSNASSSLDKDCYYKACFAMDVSKVAKEDMLRRKEKLYGLIWKTSPSKAEKNTSVYIHIRRRL